MKQRKIVSFSLIFALILGMLIAPNQADAKKKKKVALNKKKLTLTVGKTYKLKLKNNKKKIKWSSSKKKVATVSKTGKVKAKKAGTARITAKVGKKKYVCKVTVKNKKKTTKTTTTKKPTVTKAPANNTNTVKATPSPTPYVAAQSFTLSGYPSEIELVGDNDYEIYGLDVKVSPSNATEKVKFTFSDDDLAKVDANYNFIPTGVGKVKVTASISNGQKQTFECKITKATELGIHDPSVYRDPISGNYYSFGSHLVGGKSNNLVGWTADGTGYGKAWFSKDYKEEFAEAYAYTMPNGAKENAWAPDIIYNKAMKKYCMYISIVDGSKKCCIAMATSDYPDKDYKYAGMIVCSGITTGTSTDIGKTNVAKALGITDAQAKESKYAKLGTNSPDCIDPTVLYDHDGNLWMVYGSFTTAGGIRLLKLDPKTGLRGTNYADSGEGTATTLSEADPYYGLRIANNNGEGPYIQEVKSSKSSTGYYYYLWTSVGGLQSYGGYNMRMVRAEKIEGPYSDPQGNAATGTKGRSELGLRVMDNYKFSFMKNAYTSCGGNSAVEDESGRTFIHFHQKYANSTEDFTIRTHQTFENEDGWLVTAPFEFNGETIKNSYDKSQVVGDYEFIYHRTSYMRTDKPNYDYVASQRLELNEDGTVSGAQNGTWTLNGHYITIKINNQTYKGVVLEQNEQTSARDRVMVFTAIGSDNRTIWGSKMHKTDKEAVEYDASQITVPTSANEDFNLTTEGLFASKVTWTSSNDKVVKVTNGKATVTKPDAKTKVTLTATVKKGSETTTKTFTVSVDAFAVSLPVLIKENTNLVLPATTAQGTAITWTSSNTDVITKDGKVTVPATGSEIVTLTAKYGSVTKTFDIKVTSGVIDSYIYKQDFTDIANDAAMRALFVSANAADFVKVKNDTTHGNYMSYDFTGATKTNSRGMIANFGVADQTTSSYSMEFDALIKAGNNQGSEFVVTGSDFANTSKNVNYGAASGYILKLNTTNSTTWTINGGDIAEIPASWVHFNISVNPTAKTASVIISDNDKVYYQGNVTVNGAGSLGGIYVLAGRYQSTFLLDNIAVY